VGRNRTEDKVCPTAGVEFHHKRGSRVKAGEKIMSVWAADKAGLSAALGSLAQAVEYSDAPPEERRLILKEICYHKDNVYPKDSGYPKDSF
jgi:pyrimidine-nucleoside phosphorylase